MTRYLEVLDVEQTTCARYESLIRVHVLPLLGAVPLAKLSGETIDAFNAILRRCREHYPARLGRAAPRGGPQPAPPTAEQASAILTAAFAVDLWWGTLVWLAMTTGARRGELCALRWDGVDLDRGVLTVRSAIAEDKGRTWEKDTKTHQQRRIALSLSQ